MENEQRVRPLIERDGKGYFVQNDLFEYWNPGISADERVSHIPSHEREIRYVPQNYDFFHDLSLEFHEEELRLLHTDDLGIALVGGAGTGKTQALSSLAGYWIREGIFRAEEVLVITFTESETQRLADGIIKIAGQKGTAVTVTTIDRFCYHLLSSIYNTPPRIFNANDRQHFIRLIFPFLNEDMVEILCSFISSNHIDPALHTEEDIPLLRDTYLDSLFHIKGCDRDSITLQTARAVTGKPEMLFSIRQKYKCVIIDDIQCMDKQQYDLLSRIIIHTILIDTEPGRRQKIVVSVDPLQREKSAHKEHMCEMFLSDYTRRRLFLNKSWRVPGRILYSVNRLYGKEKAKMKNVPKTHKKRGSYILLYKAKDHREEAAFITEKILSLVKKKKTHAQDNYSWKDFGVFARSIADTSEITASFIRARIPFIWHNSQSFADAEPFYRINSLFHFIFSERDVAAFADILLHLLKGFSPGDVKSVFLAGNRKDEPLSVLINRLYHEHALNDTQYSEISRLLTIRKWVKSEVASSGITVGIRCLCSEFPQLEQALMNVPEQRLCYLECAESCGADIKKFLTELHFTATNLCHKQEQDSVHFSSFSFVKGLEVPVLFIPGMEEGNCPLYTQSPDIETETGLFYSAITRVKERVYLTCAETRYGEKMEISSFIKKIDSYVKEITPSLMSSETFDQGVLF